MSSKSKRQKEDAKAQLFPLETIVDELLLSILEHIESKQDLLNLCLVSRRLYCLTIGVLYRDLSLDFSAASHIRLMRRLVHAKATLPRRIQTIRVESSRVDLSLEHSDALCALFHRMTNLKLFGWTGPLGALWDLPDVIHTRFPKAIIEITDNHCFQFDPETEDDSDTEDDSETVREPITTLLTHPVQSQVTHITLCLTSSTHLYGSFKEDLVEFLNNNRILQLISIRLRDEVSFPSHNAAFEKGEVPRPTVLDLGKTKTAVFTPQELKRWGKKGGFQRLSSLTIGSMDCFRCFVGRDIGLKKLALYTTEDEDNDIDTIDEILGSANTPVPFPDLWYFSCVEKRALSRPDPLFMPVNILRWMPKITYLIFVHNANWVLERVLPMPQHIRDIRQTCPDLEHLAIEMGLTEECPTDLIKELARFEKPIKLNLFVCRPAYRYVKARWRDYWRIARQIYHERTRLGLVSGRPFAVKFTTVDQIGYMPIDKVDSPEIYFENLKTRFGEITVPRFVGDTRLVSHMLDTMTDEDLEEVQFKTVFGYPIWKRSRFAKEIKRREEYERTLPAPEDYPTLYDAMMQRDS